MNFKRDAYLQWLILLFPLIGLPLGTVTVLVSRTRQGDFRGAIAALATMFIGFTLFAIAKVAMIRKGHHISFGSKNMTPGYRRLYRFGYLLMIVGAFYSYIVYTILERS